MTSTRYSGVVKLQVRPGSVGSTARASTTRLFGSPAMPHQYTSSTPALFWSKVDRNGPVPEHRPELGRCYLWTFGLNAGGYGKVYLKADGRWRNRPAHRVAWELKWDCPFPQGMVPDHLCRVRRCVRPSHLEPVTNTANILRGEGLAAQNARKARCIRGHDDWGIRRNGRERVCLTCRLLYRGKSAKSVCPDCGRTSVDSRRHKACHLLALLKEANGQSLATSELRAHGWPQRWAVVHAAQTLRGWGYRITIADGCITLHMQEAPSWTA
jgi:hypothetical protein